MSATKEAIAAAADLLGMDVEVLIDLLLSAEPEPESHADILLRTARECDAEGLQGHALRRYRKLDELVSLHPDQLPKEWQR